MPPSIDGIEYPDLQGGDLLRCERTSQLYAIARVLFVGTEDDMWATAVLEPLPRKGIERCERCDDTGLNGGVCQVCNHFQERTR